MPEISSYIAVVLTTDAVEPDGVEALKDASPFAVFGCVPVLIDETHDVLETCDDASLLMRIARRPGGRFVEFEVISQLITMS